MKTRHVFSIVATIFIMGIITYLLIDDTLNQGDYMGVIIVVFGLIFAMGIGAIIRKKRHKRRIKKIRKRKKN